MVLFEIGELLFEHAKDLVTFWPAVVFAMAGGVAGLKYGADWLVGGASNLGFRLGMSPVLIGLTLVAFGTSSPELVVSVTAAAENNPEITLGNVIGSNIANTSLILGVTAIIFPLHIRKASVRYDSPISFAVILLVLILAVINLDLSRWDGAILLSVFTFWMVWRIRKSRTSKDMQEQIMEEAEEEGIAFHERNLLVDLGLMAVGLVTLVIGADLLVAGAIGIAETMGVPEVVVGLTIVAAGTSLPELAVCMVAALNKHGDITVGNVMGSNIFNALLILGVVLVLAPIGFQVDGFGLTGDAGVLFFDIPFCVLLCGLVIPLMKNGMMLTRANGYMLLAVYVIYLAVLLVRSL